MGVDPVQYNFVTKKIDSASYPPPVHETHAIALAATGDHRAFAWLVGEYKHMVYTASFRILRDAQEAEEATQDTFVKAYQNLSGYQGGSKFSTWLFSIAYRTAISELRKRKVKSTSLEDLGRAEPFVASADGMERTDRRAALTRAMGQLSAEDAAIINFYYQEDLSVEEIVTVTGLGASNVKVKLHRSRKRLMELLQNDLKQEAWTLIEN